MTNFKLTVQYDGTRFSGWQKQGNTDNTIQGKIENILSKMTGEEIEIHGSGRTDAGVHAIRQIANFKTNATLSELEVRDSLNKYLPLDIRILDAEKTDNRFHARLNAKGKHYRYTIEAGTIHQILPMVVYDLGVGFLPENVGIEALEDGKIIKVPLIEKIPQRQICLVESKRTPLSIAANALKQFINNYIETKLQDNL